MENCSLCTHVPICGGCLQQQIPYLTQISQKQAKIENLFQGTVYPIIPCSYPWGYRNKMEFSFSQNKMGERYLGLIMHRSRGKVLDLEECFLCPPWFIDVLEKTRNWWETTSLQAYNFRKGTGVLRTLTIREGKRTGHRLVMLTVSGDPSHALSRSCLDRWIQGLNDSKMSVFLRIQQAIKGVSTQFYEMHLSGPAHIQEKFYIHDKELVFHISPTSFFQPNTEQAEILYRKAVEIADVSSSDIVYDLYAGTGTLGMIFALSAKKVISIELNRHAVLDAQFNAQFNGLSNIQILWGDVGKILLEHQLSSPDLVVIDPPRVGLDALAIEQLKQLKSKKILYISCHPTTQAQNIEALTDYQILTIQPVDQFPHTPHIENIVLLLRKNSP